MKMRIRTITRIISAILISMILLEILPMSVIAAEYKESTQEISNGIIEDYAISPILYEVEDKREASKKVFKHEDGSYTAIVSSLPLHFKENEKWVEIDNTLTEKTVDGKSVLKNEKNSFDVSLPASITDDEAVSLKKDGCGISFYMNDISLPFLKDSILAEITEKPDNPDNASNAQKAAHFESKSSTVTYKSVNTDIDLEYTVLPDGIKENIILFRKPDDGTNFSFTLTTTGLTVTMLKDNSIEFKTAKGDVEFTIPAPFMYDENNNTSNDIQVSFVSGGKDTYTLTYTPSTEWLNDSERDYPVILDPVIKTANGTTGIDDAYFSQLNPTNNYGDSTTLLVKRETGNTCRALFNMNEDFYSLGANIRSAKLNVAVKNTNSVNTTLMAQGLTEEWTEDELNFNNRPTYNASVVDYCLITPSLTYSRKSIDVTGIFARAISGGNGFFGVMLRAMDESTTNGAIIASAEDTTNSPYFEIEYVETYGMRDIYDYHSMSAGRAGTINVNDFTGTSYIERDELGIDGNIMPVHIKRYYYNSFPNSGIGAVLESMDSYGLFWRMNYNQWIEYNSYFSDSQGRFSYIGDKGQIVYYVPTTEENDAHTKVKWVEETYEYVGDTGTTLWVPKTLTTDFEDHLDQIEITNVEGHTLKFNTDGLLIRIISAENSSDDIEIQYTGIGINILKIIDGAGREYRFSYNTDAFDYLESIQCFQESGNTPIKVKDSSGNDVDLKITYTCSTLPLAAIFESATYPDGETVTYDTDSNTHFCTAMDNIDGYRLEFPTNTYGKISSITEKAYNPATQSNVTGNSVNITYQSAYQSTFTDSNGNTEVKQFDKYGRTKCVLDGSGDYIYATYSDQEVEGKTQNLLNKVSDIKTSSMNLIENNSFEENTTGWSNWSDDSTHQFSRSSLYAAVGSCSGRLSRTTTGIAALFQDFSGVTIGAKYTLSAWVNVPDTISGQGAKVCLQAWNDGTWISETSSACVTNTNGEWVRLETSLTVPANTTKLRAHVRMNNSLGALYADGYQLEKTATAGEYNYVQNPDFTFGTDLWQVIPTGNIVTDTNNNNRAKSLDNNAYQHTGSTTTQPCLFQRVYINGAEGETFRFGAWAKESVSSVALSTGRSFTMRMQSRNADDTGNETIGRIDFNPYSTNTWQFRQDVFTLTHNTSYVDIYLSFDHQLSYSDINGTQHIGTARFDGIQLYKEAPSEESEEEPGGGEEDPTYEVTTTETKDSHGNVLSTIKSDGTKSMVTSNTYSTTGNYQASSVDENENSIYYTFNENNGQLESIAAGDENKTVEYGYTAMGALKSVSQAVSGLTNGTEIKNEYAYDNDHISSITHNGFTYSFDYDIWGNQTEVSAGSQSLVAYDYSQDSARNLNTITYGNGDTIDYTYSDGNVTGLSYDGGTSFAYTYAYADGVLTTLTDNISGTVTTYTNDGYEVRKISDNSMVYSTGSNEDGNNVEVFNGTQYTGTVIDSSTDNLTGITTDSSTVTSSGVSLEAGNVRDGFDRISSKTFKHKDSSGNTIGGMTTGYYYEDDPMMQEMGLQPSANLSTQVGYYWAKYEVDNQVTAELPFLYEYDNRGNITGIYNDFYYDENNNRIINYFFRYEYDEANQLIREDNSVTSETYTYTYDKGGNIATKLIYAYTTDEELGTPTDTISYGYDLTWKDLLISYDGETIEYDDIGNPTSYRDDSALTWQGRQLMSYTKDDMRYEYTYDDAGLRTSQKFYEDDVLQRTFQYIWKDGVLTGQIMTVPGSTEIITLKYVYDQNNEPQGFVYTDADDTKVICYLKDAQGNVIGLVDADTGEMVTLYLYDAWGNVTYSVSNMEGIIMLALNSITYRGYCCDLQSGLYYLQSRYYDSATGRFLNADDVNVLQATSEELLGANLFSYCNNNPVMNKDPNGYLTLVSAIVGGIVAGIIEAVAQSFKYFITHHFSLIGFRFNKWKIGWEVAWGFAFGALIPTCFNRAQMAVISGCLNVLKTLAENLINHRRVNFYGIGISFIVGLVSGLIGGSGIGKILPGYKRGASYGGGKMYIIGGWASTRIPLNSITIAVFARNVLNYVLGTIVGTVASKAGD